MTSALIDRYLDSYPKEAATVIAAEAPANAAHFITQLDTARRANILMHVLPLVAQAYLIHDTPARVGDALNLLRPMDIARLLQNLTAAERAPLLACLSPEKRASVRHQLRYPRGSVGSILIVPAPAARESATVKQAKGLVRRLASSEAVILTVLDQDMRPVGQLDFGQLLRLRGREPIAVHMQRVPHRFHARADLHTVASHEAWAAADYLPAVGPEEVFVGLISKARLFNELADPRAAVREDGRMLAAALEFADMMWNPAAEWLSRVTASGRP